MKNEVINYLTVVILMEEKVQKNQRFLINCLEYICIGDIFHGYLIIIYLIENYIHRAFHFAKVGTLTIHALGLNVD
jgi:hypothetical protein